MNKSMVMAVLSVAGIASIASAQNGYTFEYRIIADGDAGAPSGTWPSAPISNTATSIGFWIQARVSQTVNTNWGIGRATAPAAPNCDFITVTDGAAIGSTTLNRGRTSTAASTGTSIHTGRGAGYTSGGLRSSVANGVISQDTPTGNNGNNTGANTNAGLMPAAFPGVTNAENGAFDSAGDRIYGFDAYVGGTRTGLLDGDGSPTINPWNVNGAAGTVGDGTGATPVANGVFSPWANLYRFNVILDGATVNTQRTITLNSSAQLNGTVQAAETSPGSGSFAMQLASPGTVMSTQYSFVWGNVPTPGAAALMGMGMLAAGRRRR